MRVGGGIKRRVDGLLGKEVTLGRGERLAVGARGGYVPLGTP